MLFGVTVVMALGIYVLTSALGYQNSLIWLVVFASLAIFMVAFIVRDLILRRSSSTAQANEAEVMEFVKYDMTMMPKRFTNKKSGTWHGIGRVVWLALNGVAFLIVILQLFSSTPSILLSIIGGGVLIGSQLFLVALKLFFSARVIVLGKLEHLLEPATNETETATTKLLPLLKNPPTQAVTWSGYFLVTGARLFMLFAIAMLGGFAVYWVLDTLGYGDAPWAIWNSVLSMPVLFVLFAAGFITRDVILRRSSATNKPETDSSTVPDSVNWFMVLDMLDTGIKKGTTGRRTVEMFIVELVFVASLILLWQNSGLPNLPDAPAFLVIIAAVVMFGVFLAWVIMSLLFPAQVAVPLRLSTEKVK